jgi:hypothetical protein
MQKLVYTVEVDEEFTGLDSFREILDFTTENELGCGVIRSKLESPDEVCENGEWEEDRDD